MSDQISFVFIKPIISRMKLKLKFIITEIKCFWKSILIKNSYVVYKLLGCIYSVRYLSNPSCTEIIIPSLRTKYLVDMKIKVKNQVKPSTIRFQNDKNTLTKYRRLFTSKQRIIRITKYFVAQDGINFHWKNISLNIKPSSVTLSTIQKQREGLYKDPLVVCKVKKSIKKLWEATTIKKKSYQRSLLQQYNNFMNLRFGAFWIE